MERSNYPAQPASTRPKNTQPHNVNKNTLRLNPRAYSCMSRTHRMRKKMLLGLTSSPPMEKSSRRLTVNFDTQRRSRQSTRLCIRRSCRRVPACLQADISRNTLNLRLPASKGQDQGIAFPLQFDVSSTVVLVREQGCLRLIR